MITRSSAVSMVALAASVVALASLGGCGKVGYLEQPAPLWGEKAKADFKAREADRNAAAKAAQGGVPEPLSDSVAPPEPGAATPVPSPPVPPVSPQ
jgi:hypothetical protein